MAAVIAAATLALAGCAGAEEPGSPQAGERPTTATAAEEPSGGSDGGSPTTGPCAYEPTPGEPASRPVSLPDDPSPTPTTGPATLTLETNNGAIAITFDREQAPCTVQSIAHLAAEGFYDDTPCHRIVPSDNFKILQCGDPTGSGTGGPGYTIPDEFPTGLAQAPVGGGAQVYPRGSVAMANTGQPGSGGSQFFLVFGSTFLPPTYTIFGTIDEAGLTALETIGDAGVEGGASDGPPALATTITKATLDG